MLQHIALKVLCSCAYSFIHSFILAISIAPLQVLYHSEALPTTARILYRSFTLKRTGNCRYRTCPRSLRDGQSGSRTHDPPVESNRLNQCAITSHNMICLGRGNFCLMTTLTLILTLMVLAQTLIDHYGAFESFCAPVFCDCVRNYSCIPAPST